MCLLFLPQHAQFTPSPFIPAAAQLINAAEADTSWLDFHTPGNFVDLDSDDKTLVFACDDDVKHKLRTVPEVTEEGSEDITEDEPGVGVTASLSAETTEDTESTTDMAKHSLTLATNLALHVPGQGSLTAPASSAPLTPSSMSGLRFVKTHSISHEGWSPVSLLVSIHNSASEAAAAAAVAAVLTRIRDAESDMGWMDLMCIGSFAAASSQEGDVSSMAVAVNRTTAEEPKC